MFDWFQPKKPQPRPFPRADERVAKELHTSRQRIDQQVFWGLIVQWVAIGLVSLGASTSISTEQTDRVWMTLILSGVLTAVPLWLTLRSSGERTTRLAVAVSQGLIAVLLLGVSGGRPETQVHLFGWLVVLSLYRDIPVLLTAGIVACVGYLAISLISPGEDWSTVAAGSWSEHVLLLFGETACLVAFVRQSLNTLSSLARREAALESLNKNVDRRVDRMTRSLIEEQTRLRHENETLRERRESAETSEFETSRMLTVLRQGVSTHATNLMDTTWRWSEASLPEPLRPAWRTIRESTQTLLNLVTDSTPHGLNRSTSLVGLPEVSSEPIAVVAGSSLFSKPRALLMIDDPVQQALTVHALAQEGFSVEVVHTGPRAYYSLMMRNYEVILVDIDLPDDEGFDTLEALRMLPNGIDSSTKMFAITSSQAAERVLRATTLDVAGLLNKPVKPAALRSVLSSNKPVHLPGTKTKRLECISV